MGSDGFYVDDDDTWSISIHTPRMGSDMIWLFGLASVLISIHTPRMGSDACNQVAFKNGNKFQSTLPAWGVTSSSFSEFSVSSYFNPHSPHGE